jgi:hypothetical protein
VALRIDDDQSMERSRMTYIASPRTDFADPARKIDCRQCVETAFDQLTEFSDESEVQQDSRLIAAGLAAGWEEIELRYALQDLRTASNAANILPDLTPEASSLSIQPVVRTTS